MATPRKQDMNGRLGTSIGYSSAAGWINFNGDYKNKGRSLPGSACRVLKMRFLYVAWQTRSGPSGPRFDPPGSSGPLPACPAGEEVRGLAWELALSARPLPACPAGEEVRLLDTT